MNRRGSFRRRASSLAWVRMGFVDELLIVLSNFTQHGEHFSNACAYADPPQHAPPPHHSPLEGESARRGRKPEVAPVGGIAALPSPPSDTGGAAEGAMRGIPERLPPLTRTARAAPDMLRRGLRLNHSSWRGSRGRQAVRRRLPRWGDCKARYISSSTSEHCRNTSWFQKRGTRQPFPLPGFGQGQAQE